jgi:ABC-type branched-subunit amino acid transport system substrate-binding protein
MKKKAGIALVAVLAVTAAALAALLGGRATPAASAAAKAGPSCQTATIAVTGPFTGSAASAGLDQRGWARLLIDDWNSGKTIPGTPKGFKRTKIKGVEFDTQLNSQVSATVATRIRSDSSIVAVNGFSGSQENVAGGPILRRGGLVFVSGSATRASLTDATSADGQGLKTGFFYRVVPNDDFQSDVDATFVLKKMGVKKGDHVMTIDQAEAYSVPLSTAITKKLEAAGAIVDHQSQEVAQTDFTSVANRAVAEKVKAVVFASQVASNAQLLFSQLHAAGYTGGFLGTDGTFDTTKFKVPGAYVSSFSLDAHKLVPDKAYVADFTKRFGDTNSFGLPTWVAVQMIAMAVSQACTDGKISRGEVRRIVPTLSLPTSLLGKPIAFQKNGDQKGGVSFTIFQIGSDGSYKVVQPG